MNDGAAESAGALLLLDTHVWIWLIEGVRGELCERVIRAADEASRQGSLLIAAISVREVAMLERRGRISLSYDHIVFDYQNFRDLGAGGTVGQEPLYGFSADVLQLYLSLWY